MIAIRLILFTCIILIPSFYMSFLGLSTKKFNLDNFLYTDLMLHDHRYEMITTDVFRYIKNNSNKDDIFLTFRPSDFGIYAERPFYSYIDEKLVKVFQAKTKKEIHQELSKLNIKYIHLPYYYEPGIYNSKLFEYIADLNYIEPVYQSPNYGIRILKIIKLNNYSITRTIPLKEWTYYNNYFNESLFKPYLDALSPHLLNTQNFKTLRNEFLTYSSIISGTGAKDSLAKDGIIYKNENEIYKLNFQAKGKGFISVYIHEFNYNNEKTPIKFLLNTTIRDIKTVSTLYKPSMGTKLFRIEIRSHKNALVKISKIKLDIFKKNISNRAMSKLHYDYECKRIKNNNFIELDCGSSRKKSYIKLFPISIGQSKTKLGHSNLLIRTKASGTVYFTINSCNTIQNKDNHILKAIKNKITGKLINYQAPQKNYVSNQINTYETILSVSNAITNLCLEYQFSRADDFFRFNSKVNLTKKQFALQSIEIYKLINNNLKLLDILPKKSR